MKDRKMSTGIPKSVREAMSKQAVKGPHPATDELNAYAERALTEQENAFVTSHLATCVSCREVVFLANSAVEIPAKAVILVERRSMWRWAMPATALLAVAIAFTVLVRTENPKGTSVAQLQKATETTSAPSDKYSASLEADRKASGEKIVTASAPKEAAAAKKEQAPEKKTRAAHDTIAPIAGLAKAEPRPPLSASGITSSGRVLGGLIAAKGATAPAIPAGNVANGQTLEMRQNSNMPNAMGGPRASQNIVQSQTAPQSLAGNYRSDTVLKDAMAAPPPPAAPPASGRDSDTKLPEEKSQGELQSFAASSMELDAQPQKQRNALSRMAITVWRISSDGHLERMMQNQWKRALGGVQQSFRAVAYLGSHVWAGGAGPELYHSADGGENWKTLKVKTEDAELRGAMQSIKATDDKHVAIIADDGSIWVTADGGQTWAKQ